MVSPALTPNSNSPDLTASSQRIWDRPPPFQGKVMLGRCRRGPELGGSPPPECTIASWLFKTIRWITETPLGELLSEAGTKWLISQEVKLGLTRAGWHSEPDWQFRECPVYACVWLGATRRFL